MMKQLFHAVDAIYAAGLDASPWPEALQKIADVFDDVGTAMVFRRDDGSAGFIISPSLVEAHDEYNQRWASHDLRTLRALSRFTHVTDRARRSGHCRSGRGRSSSISISRASPIRP